MTNHYPIRSNSRGASPYASNSGSREVSPLGRSPVATTAPNIPTTTTAQHQQQQPPRSPGGCRGGGHQLGQVGLTPFETDSQGTATSSAAIRVLTMCYLVLFPPQRSPWSSQSLAEEVAAELPRDDDDVMAGIPPGGDGGGDADEGGGGPKYRVCVLGQSGTGKTALVSQFLTSEYMNTYDASLGECLRRERGNKG